MIIKHDRDTVECTFYGTTTALKVDHGPYLDHLR